MVAAQPLAPPEPPRRAAPRNRTFRELEIIDDYGAVRIFCTTRDLSETGAKIALPSEVDLPDRFLLVDPISGISREARSVWREGAYAGIEFLLQPKVAGPLGGLLRWLRGE